MKTFLSQISGYKLRVGPLEPKYGAETVKCHQTYELMLQLYIAYCLMHARTHADDKKLSKIYLVMQRSI